MKKIILWLAIILVAASITHAVSTDYEGWVYNNKFLSIDSVSYRVLITEAGKSALLRSENDAFSIDLNKCIEKNFKSICYDNTVFDKDLQEYKAYFIINSKQPEITLTRSISDNILSVGDSSDFHAVIANIGEGEADNVTFYEEFPDNVEIENVENAQIVGNKVFWSGELKAGDNRDIEYRIRSTGLVDRFIKASVKYFDGVQEKEVLSDSVRLYSTTTVNIEMKTDKEDYQIGEEINLTVTIRNNGAEAADMDQFYLVIPEGTIMVDRNILSRTDDLHYFLEETIDAGEIKAFSIIMKAGKTGAFIATAGCDYASSNQDYKISNIKGGYLVHDEGVEVTTTLDSAVSVSSNQLLPITVRVKNKNSFAKIKSIVLITTSDIANFEKSTYGSADTNETVLMMNNEIRIPVVNEEKSYQVVFNLSYSTEDNETHRESFTRSIAISPQKTIEIIPTLSETRAAESAVVTVGVSLINPESEEIKEIYLSAAIPPGLTASGSTSGYTTLEAGAEQQLLSFKLIPGIIGAEDKKYQINFTASYLLGGSEYIATEQSELTVYPRIPDIRLQKITSDDSAFEGEIIDVSYKISNADTIPISDIALLPGETQEYDNINIFSYSLEKLNPGEEMTVQTEQIRPKKAGMQETGHSLLYFSDKYGRRFNVTSASNAVMVKDAEINSPAVFLQKTASKEIIYAGQSVLITINVSNIGQKPAEGNLSDINRSILIPFYSSTDFVINQTFDIPGLYIIPKSVFHYYFLNNEVRAYSNELTLTVLNSTDPNAVVIPEQNNGQGAIKNDSGTQPTQKMNFFARIYFWFKGLFKKI